MNPAKFLRDANARTVATLLVIIFLLASGLAWAGLNALQEAKHAVVGVPPEYPPELVDHGGRAETDTRGSLFGAASKVYPRPTAYLADRGIVYHFYGSPNWSSRGQNAIDGIVVHVTGPGTCPGMRSWFSNPTAGASAQFGVCKDGSIEQYVEVGDGAWHAGIVNRPDMSNPYIASMVAAGVNPNSRTVGIELLLAPGENLSDYPEMKASFYALMNWLHDTTGVPFDRNHIIGHYQIDGVNRSVDPRCCVELDTVVFDLAGGVVAPPASPWGDCDATWGDCWLLRPAWVFPDGSVYDVESGQHWPLP